MSTTASTTVPQVVPRVIGVRFSKAGPLQFLEPSETIDAERLRNGQRVVAKTAKGLELAFVATLSAPLFEIQTKGSIVREATSEDLQRDATMRGRAAETLTRAQARVDEHGLPMRILAAQWTLDSRYVTLTFWAENRVDFRGLVRDLARLFQARVELHQVGDRERAKLRGGLGRCGRPLCCATWLVQPAQVTVHMAREQELLQSMPELAGSCGRLLCCLRFEYADYLAGKSDMPPPGQQVLTPEGAGVVVKRDLMRDRVTVRLEANTTEFPASSVTLLNASENPCEDCPEAPTSRS